MRNFYSFFFQSSTRIATAPGPRVDVCTRPSSQSTMVVEKLEQEMGVKGEMMNW
jgi:hypothetical protein